MTRYFLFILLMWGISGCNQATKKDFQAFFNTMTITPTPEKVREHFQQGELIRIETLEGTIYQFNVVDVTDTEIVGKRQQIPFSEIYQITKQY